MLLGVLALFAGVSTAGPILDEAADRLRKDPVYVHPDANSLVNESAAEDLRSSIRGSTRPIYVAVLPTSAEAEAGGLDELPAAVGSSVGLRGTYAVVTPKGFRARSNDLEAGVAERLATASFNESKDGGATAILSTFVERVKESPSGTSGDGGSSSADGDKESGGSGLTPILLIGGAIAGGVYFMRKGNKRRQQEQVALVGDQEDLRSELSVLADDVMRLEDDVSINPAARDDYEAGVARFKWAQAAVDSIDSADDVPRVRRGMAEAQYAMARARAIIQGHEPPDPPVELQQQGRYGEPAIHLDDRRQPQYAGYERDGGGWGGGGFFAGNGLFTGLLLGQMLGGGMGWGGGGHEHHGDSSGNDGGGDFGGDVGGGDFGGGDFGGGDVGGGDF